MWLIAMFDLPTDTPEARRAYRDFRELLLGNGFSMLQFSVYARHVASEEAADVHANRVQAALPPDGEVRLLRLTDKQFSRMAIFVGKIRAATEKAPEQISFF